MTVISTVELNGVKLEVWQDDPTSPRENDNLTKMICFHGNYNLGDSDTGYKQEDNESWEELAEEIKQKEKPIIIQPLYMLDHGGITISTGEFSCKWDSGQIGFVYISNKEIDELGVTINEGESWKEYVVRLKLHLVGEVEIYNTYLQGEVYGFTVTPKEGESDSCGGFYGNDWKNNGMSEHVPEELINLLY